MGNLSRVVQTSFAVASIAQMPLLKSDIPLALKFVYQYLLDSRLVALTP